MNTKNDILRLEQEFKDCQKALIAIGDETRQHILMMMLEGECSGNRVVDITKKRVYQDRQYLIICRY